MTLHVSPNGPYVIQANTVNAEVLRQALAADTGGGIVHSGDMVVTANGTPNHTVNIAAGTGIVPGTEAAAQGSYLAYNDASVSLDILGPHPSDPTNPRLDLVVLAVQDAQYSGALNAPVFASITGTPAGSPTLPTIPVSPYFNSIPLCSVAVAANATTITSGNITDLRTRTGPGYLTSVSFTGSIGSIGGDTLICTTPSVIMPAGRRVKISFVCFQFYGSVEGDVYQIRLQDSVAGLLSAQNAIVGGTTAGAVIAPSLFTLQNPAAGAHTWSVHAIKSSGSGTGTMDGSGYPATLLIEDLGPV